MPEELIDDVSTRDINGPADNTEEQGGVQRSRQQEDKPAAKEEEVVPKIPLGPSAIKRNQLYEKAREKRTADEEAAGFRPFSEEQERSMFGDKVETRGDRDVKREEAANPAPAPQPTAERVETSRRRLRVNGRDVELTDEELAAAAQKGLAAEDVLGEAKRVRAQYLQELEEIRLAKANHSRQQDPDLDDTSDDSSEDTKPENEELDDIIDGIQVGDKNEARAALLRLQKQSEERVLKQIGNIEERVSKTINSGNIEAAINQDIVTTSERFFNDNPDFGEVPAMSKYLIKDANERMERNLRDVGVDDGLFAQIMSRDRISKEQAVALAYRVAMANGVQVPHYREVLSSSAESIRRDFGRQAPTPRGGQPADPDFTASRQARKEAITPTPRRSSVSPGTSQPERSEDDKRREYLQQRRAWQKGRR